MNIALAQIDMRLGDIESICSRIEDQVALAAKQDADVLCTPAPLFAGILPGSLIEYPNYEHALMSALSDLAATVEETGVTCLIPALVGCEGGPLFEVFMLRKGRVVPTRLTALRHREGTRVDSWAPPVFDIAGTRVAVTFDLFRDITELPSGCDLLIFFQVNGLDITNEVSSAVASVMDGRFREEVSRAGIWTACMAPVGGYDEAAYTGGSFVMDDDGRVVAAAPCFEECLLVQEVRRGVVLPALGTHELPAFNREEWLWEALRLHVRDTVVASGSTRVILQLEGDLPSSLLAALAVDALGSRNVIGVLSERPDAVTPAAETHERERVELARRVAEGLHIRLLERSATDLSRLFDRNVSAADALRLRRQAEALCFADMAHELRAYPLSSLTKTDCALAPSAPRGDAQAGLAPFADVYLTELEFLARVRNRASAVLPQSIVALKAVEDRLARIMLDATAFCEKDVAYTDRIKSLLEGLEPSQVDGVLEAHVDRNLGFDEIPLAERSPEAVALLLMLVRRGEGARRRLPLTPIVSARSFSERVWPAGLAWSDLGRGGSEPLRAADLAKAETERAEAEGAEHGDRVREEILNLLGGLLGLSPEQQRELQSEEGQRKMREDFERFEGQLHEALGKMMSDGGIPMPGQVPPGSVPRDFPFFSQN